MLTTQEKLSYELLLRDLDIEVEGQQFPAELLAISQMEGVQQIVPDTLNFMPHESVEDYDTLLQRLRAVPRLVDQTIALLKQGVDAGVVQPGAALSDLPSQILGLVPEQPATTPLLNHFRSFPIAFSAIDKNRLRDEANEVYRQRIRPAYLRLHKFLVNEYLPNAQADLRRSALMNGAAWYAYRVKVETTTTLTPQEVHKVGLREVARIREAMEKLPDEAKFAGTFSEFKRFLQTDSQFFYQDRESFLAGYREITKRIDPELPRFFGKLPRLPYGVKATPTYAENSAPDAIYEYGSWKSGRAGYFVANTSHLETRPKWEMPALTLHEAVPGHHLQISLAQEMDSVPEFRKYLLYTPFVEGWALYAESLGYELGSYRNAYEKYGALSYEMWRASRLVVDTGLQTMGWSRQQSIDYIVSTTGTDERNSAPEVDRYLVWPGQALAYKIGELKIKELRSEAEKRLGSHFDLRKFHDFILSHGAIPMNVLERVTQEWIEQQGV